MAKFNVTLYYHTNVTVEVEAENEEEALEIAEMEVDDEKYNTSRFSIISTKTTILM